MANTNMPRTATLDDAAEISGALARAFDDDPMMRWFFPEDATREASLGTYFDTIFTRQYAVNGVCERTGSAAAFWVPAEAADKAVPDGETIAELQRILGDRAEAFRDAVGAAAQHTPREPHWYLALIGADPAVQGKGEGGALLRSGLARADAAGLPVYLESSKKDNLPVYEHFGFTVSHEVQLPGGGPVLWGMWREARRPAAA
ncbi:GNAT family N-acetyltransferase [Streptomyces clavuligerus]|uniref:Putative acetyltransferase n=1 Tax=Streptomyces clavuligerus TaxID=1901 RepID=E2Q124_STRCL|nr:GNAT family N-acetyltransferase [Streptomyces clavuligerus]ANW18787.1 acetyltransferase [Streptomyces clavuligerus]AXU13357.1 GNAT family N-acetyltransferase [Streptomyces clavuligerus]EFG08529.1 putative acetyltransferase [Streptomyces clavuligerus]MBY6303312.1 GNAT family N-acetyltransferase [Streptomyces clavuligerus]QCS06140.1 N-acetyltransferase [Streptomyces clavuligerus]